MLADTTGVIATQLQLEDVLAARLVCKRWSECFAVPPISAVTAEVGFYMRRHNTAICFGHKPADDTCDINMYTTGPAVKVEISGKVVDFPIVVVGGPNSSLANIFRQVLGKYIYQCPVYVYVGEHFGTIWKYCDSLCLRSGFREVCLSAMEYPGDVMIYTSTYGGFCTMPQYREMQLEHGTGVSVAVHIGHNRERENL